jgi:hypothetical protein
MTPLIRTHLAFPRGSDANFRDATFHAKARSCYPIVLKHDRFHIYR